MTIQPAWNTRPIPYVEDKQTTPIRKLGNIGINGVVNFIETHNFGAKLTRGDLHNAFEGYLNFQGSKNLGNS